MLWVTEKTVITFPNKTSYILIIKLLKIKSLLDYSKILLEIILGTNKKSKL